MFLNKFYDEGSFATIVAVWNNGQWIGYGDSVAFCYNKKTGELQHSFTSLSDFNNPPYLINCKDPLNPIGFRPGKFDVVTTSVLFAASDALAHYILLMYEVAHRDVFQNELQEAVNAQTRNSDYIKAAMGATRVDFEDVIKKLPLCNNQGNFRKHLQSLRKKGLIGHDDYSIAMF